MAQDRIKYRVAVASQTNLASRSVDLITVGQALHWFNLEQFYQEVRRVSKPHGAIAVWCYGFFHLPAEETSLDRVLQEFHAATESFWPPERELVQQKYQSIPFPFVEKIPPNFTMNAEWIVDNLIGYLLTWSATSRFIEQHSFEPVAEFAKQMQDAWGNPQSSKLIQWPLYIRIGHLD